MEMQKIVPQYKLMLFYDLPQSNVESYLHFVMTEMVPQVQAHNVLMFQIFHTVWGENGCPLRQAEFVAEDLGTIQDLLDSDDWHDLETKLLTYTTNYRRKVVKFRPGFQI
jgi:hypothetical protein